MNDFLNQAKIFLKAMTLQKLVPTAIILVCGIIGIRVILKLFDKGVARSKLDKTAHAMVRSLARILLYFILCLIMASYLQLDVSSLVALLSVVSLAVTLAVQGALSNLVGGFTVLSTHPFKVGDYVEMDQISGTVSEVGMSYTKLTTPDNKMICVPNSTVASSLIVNYSAQDKRRIEISVTASYDSPVEGVKAALLEAANVEDTLFTPAPFASVSNYDDSSIAYVLRVWVTSERYWDAYYEIMERVKQQFDANGIEMTYPHLNVHMDA